MLEETARHAGDLDLIRPYSVASHDFDRSNLTIGAHVRANIESSTGVRPTVCDCHSSHDDRQKLHATLTGMPEAISDGEDESTISRVIISDDLFNFIIDGWKKLAANAEDERLLAERALGLVKNHRLKVHGPVIERLQVGVGQCQAAIELAEMQLVVLGAAKRGLLIDEYLVWRSIY